MFKRVGLGLLLLFSQPMVSAGDWFYEQSSLTRAHQLLLEDDLTGSFSAMVQAWQTENAPYIAPHLNELLLKSLDKDCGKSLHSEESPDWLKRVVVRKQSVQSPGRHTERVTVEVNSGKEVDTIELTKWPDEKLSNASAPEQTENNREGFVYQQSYTLNRTLEPGLYQLNVHADGEKEVWHSWIIISHSSPKQIVRWLSQDSWVVDKQELLNSYCPLPVLNASLYDYADSKYVQVWHQDYEVNYPSVLPAVTLEPNRYVLAVSIAHKRWQGQILIEEQQVISKTYDISEE